MNKNLMQCFNKFLLLTGFILLSACGGGGGGGVGGGGGGGMPTPTLPASAVTIDTTNADSIAALALGFTDTFFMLAGLKTEAPPSIPNVIKIIIDEVIKRERVSPSVAIGVTEDIPGLCLSGTATATFTETGNDTSGTESGTVSFSSCEFPGGVLLNGSVNYNADWNATFNYDISLGGTLTFDIGTDAITIVMSLSETGNDDTGAFSATISYSVSGAPDGDFLVTTPEAWVGNIIDGVDSGVLMIQGANDTRLRITVSSPNVGTIALDNGDGNFIEIDQIIL